MMSFDGGIVRLEFTREQSAEDMADIQEVLTKCKKHFKNPLNQSLGLGDIGAFASEQDGILKEENFDDSDWEKMERNEKLIEITRTMSTYVQDWITFIDKYIFTGERLAAVDFLDCVVLSKYGVIDYALTARNLLKHRIGAVNVMKIVCVHCLEDKIYEIKFPEVLPEMYSKTERLVKFWRAYKKRNVYTEDLEDIIHIVNYENYSALTFFWNKLTETQKIGAIKKIFEHGKVDLHRWWLNEMTTEEQKYVMSICGGCVLINLMNDFLKGIEFYDAARFARDILSNEDYLNVMVAASAGIQCYSWTARGVHIQCFEYIWEIAPERGRVHIYEEFHKHNLFWFIKEFPSIEFFKRFFGAAPQWFKKDHLNSSFGKAQLVELWYEGHQDLFHYYVDATFSSEQAVRYKMKIINEQEIDLFDGGEVTKSVENMFKTEEAIARFKKQYLYQGDSNELRKIIEHVFFTDGDSFHLNVSPLVDYARLYVSDEEVETYKRTGLCKSRQIRNAFLRVIQDDRYDLVDEFLKWSIADDDQIKEYKSHFFAADVENAFAEVVNDFIIRDDEFVSLRTYFSWFSFADKNRDEMRKSLFQNTKKMMGSWRYLLYELRFHAADEFLDLCGAGEDVQAVKDELFLKINWIYMMFDVEYKFCVQRVRDLEAIFIQQRRMFKVIEWFNPSPATSLQFLISKYEKTFGTITKKKMRDLEKMSNYEQKKRFIILHMAIVSDLDL